MLILAQSLSSSLYYTIAEADGRKATMVLCGHRSLGFIGLVCGQKTWAAASALRSNKDDDIC